MFLKTENGYLSTQEPYNQVRGHVFIERVDFESAVYILDFSNKPCPSFNKFKGKKLTLKDFINLYNKDYFSLEIITEAYAYNTLLIKGFIYYNESILEIFIDLYFQGNYIYLIGEDNERDFNE